MSIQSYVCMLDVKLMFSKAENRVWRGVARANKLHTGVGQRVTDCLENIPSNCATTEENIVAAFQGQRFHNVCGEPFYWEQAYRILPNDTARYEPIPIDEANKSKHTP